MNKERLIRKREIDVNMHNARHTQVTNDVKLFVFNDDLLIHTRI